MTCVDSSWPLRTPQMAYMCYLALILWICTPTEGRKATMEKGKHAHEWLEILYISYKDASVEAQIMKTTST